MLFTLELRAMENTMTTETVRGLFSVNFWGSHPDEGNDDCYTGADYATLAEALQAFESGHLCDATCGCKLEARKCANLDSAYYRTSIAYVELDGPGINQVRKNPTFRPSRRRDNFDAEWKHEMAMEAGMLHGCEGFNEVMGY